MPIHELTPAIVIRAIALSQRCQISYWNAAVLDAARTAGCAPERDSGLRGRARREPRRNLAPPPDFHRMNALAASACDGPAIGKHAAHTDERPMSFTRAVGL